MFNGMSSLTSLALPNNFDTSKITSGSKMHQMFYGMSSLATLSVPDCFVVPEDTTRSDMLFTNIRNTAVLYASDAKMRSLWPGRKGN